MRRMIKRSFLFAATFAALLAVSISHAHAQPAQFDVAGCKQAVQTGLLKGSQETYQTFAGVFQNAQLPTMNQNCIGPLMSAFSTLNLNLGIFAIFGNIVTALVQQLIQQIVQQVCQVVSSAISSAISLVKNAVCLPIPGLNLKLGFNLGSFSGGACNGIQLIPALTGFGTQRNGVFSGLGAWTGQ